MTEPETPPAVDKSESGGTDKKNGSESSTGEINAAGSPTPSSPEGSNVEQSEASSGDSPEAQATDLPDLKEDSKTETDAAGSVTTEDHTQSPHLRSAATLADPMSSQAGRKANPVVAFLVLGGFVAVAGVMGSFLWRDGGQDTPGAEAFQKIDNFARDNFRQKAPDQKPAVGTDWRRKEEEEQKIFELKLAQIDQDFFKKSNTPNDHTRRDVIMFLADAYRRSENQWPMAEKYYTMALALPEDGPHTAAHPMSRMELQYRIAETYFHLMRYPLAEQLLTAAKAEPSRLNLTESGASFWKHEIDYLMAECLIEQGKFPEAEKILNERKKVDQDPYSKALLQRDFGILWARQGKIEDAEKQFSAALQSFDSINGTAARPPVFDNDRKVATLLDEYAKLLRQMKQPEKQELAYAYAKRSREIRDNPPPGMIVPK